MTEGEPILLVPAGPAGAEIRVSNSRFVAAAGPTASGDEARAFRAAVRTARAGATHHVYAYRIGHPPSTTEGQSDAGEPPGTAGRPVLAVLRGSGLGDVTLVVSRYFGGTLLGTGGLVHAYTAAAQAVLAVLPRAAKIAQTTLTVAIPYAAYDAVRRLLATHAATIQEETFAAAVTLQVRLPAAQAEAVAAALRDATAGAATITPGPSAPGDCDPL